MNTGTPMTEERFRELFGTLFDAKFEERIQSIHTAVKELRAFQKHEADGIEFELYLVLKRYLQRRYQLMTIKDFPMKIMKDPYTDKPITDFDAAFLLSPYAHKPDYMRLREVGMRLPRKEPIQVHQTIFALAEAKHYMNRKKIAKKLLQFELLRQIFREAKRIVHGSPCNGFPCKYNQCTDAFVKTVMRNTFLAEIDECYLFLGAAVWEKGLLEKLQADVQEYKQLAAIFPTSEPAKKLELYKRASELDNEWYKWYPKQPIHTLMDNEILQLDALSGPLQYVEMIYPSGDRYHMRIQDEPSGYVGGRGRTRRARKN